MIDKTSIERELSQRSFYHFMKRFWRELETVELVDNWHIEYLANTLQKEVERISRKEVRDGDIAINICPNATKSRITSIFLPVWAWIHDPTLKIVSASHTHGLVKDFTKESRRLIRSERFQATFPEIQIQPDSDQDTDYFNTSGGRRVGVSVGSPKITGIHSDLIILDDLVSTDASPNDIKKANEWMTKNANRARRNKEVSTMILIMQRVSDKDPTANLLRKESTKHICIPAEITENTKHTVTPRLLLKNYVDGLMDVHRLKRSVLEEEKVTLGTRTYTVQYLQSATPSEGGIIKNAWIKIRPRKPELIRQLNDIPPQFFIDTAYTEEKENDPSAMITVKKFNNDIIIVDAEQVWKEFNELVSFIESKTYEQGATYESKIYCEPKACFEGDTKVKTVDGYKEIRDITSSDKVYTVNESSQDVEIKSVHDQIVHNDLTRDMIEVTLNDNTKINATADHEFYIKGNWTELQRITKRAMEMGHWRESEVRGVESGEGSNANVERNELNQRVFVRDRHKRLSQNGIDNQWQKKAHIYSSVRSRALGRKSRKQINSKPQKFYKDRQPGCKLRVDDSCRKQSTRVASRPMRKRGVSERPQASSRSLAGHQQPFTSIGSRRRTLYPQTLCPGRYKLHKVSSQVRYGSKLNDECSEAQDVEAREIDPNDIVAIKYYTQSQPVYDLQIEDNHNFLITNDNIIVHNSGKSIVQYMKQTTALNIIEDTPPNESKDSRLASVSPLIEAGRVSFLEGRWNEEVQTQLTSYKPAHDEYRDTIVMAIKNMLIKDADKSYGEVDIRL